MMNHPAAVSNGMTTPPTTASRMDHHQEIFTTQQEEGCTSSLCSINGDTWGTKEYKSTIDMDLAKEMNSLSVQEREKVYEEIHGVREAVEETPEFVKTSLEAMDVALKDLPRTRRKALDRAFFLYPGLTRDVKFKLMFLRTDYFDPGKAARRMAKHFEDKLVLFGEEKLVKKITLDDLDEKAIEASRSGCCLELPQRDPTGRPIWFFDGSKYMNMSNLDSLMRASWYQIMATVQDDEIAQKLGVFDVTYAPGNLLTMPTKLAQFPELLRRTGDVIVSLPCRVTSYHFCYEDERLRSILSIVQKYFGRHLRLRVRTHYGSPIEIQYSMMTFGVSCHALLRGVNEIDKQRLRHNYLQQRMEIEQEEERRRGQEELETGIIVYPKKDDVLVGRGRPYQDFAGNLRLSRLVDAHMPWYWQCTNRFEKTCLFLDLVKKVQEYGGRFLERKPEGWSIVSGTVAREKVSSGFRTKVLQANAASDSKLKLSGGGPGMFRRSPKRVKV